jgi:hypothetical protein
LPRLASFTGTTTTHRPTSTRAPYARQVSGLLPGSVIGARVRAWPSS